MKITFPHMGNTYITAKALLDDFGVDYEIPPFNNKKALETGTKYAPEMACLPLKMNLGNYIEASKKGADTILIMGGCGPCRFGYYCEMSREILQDNGYNMDILTLELPNGNIKGFIKRIKKLTGGLNIFKIIKVLKDTVFVSKKVDELERLTFKFRPIEVEKGSVDKIYKEFQNKILKSNGSKEILRLTEETKNKILKLKIDKKAKPIKIGIVGEIYTTIDSFTSFNVEKILGNMGIEVDRSITISDWIVEHILKAVLPIKKDDCYKTAAKPYLGAMIGGHAQETIGNTVIYAEKGYDGVIQIYPLTCMPEIVSESILPSVERDLDIPVLTLIIDELTGEAGYMTRLEAFIDLLEKRRERAEIGDKFILSGN
ncbi:CoA protein activase [Herbivorax sp. ANBcel31]|uniref:CoA protein activase n=1 Tax=Herbivorax sp. ANBcel31 TaxID=3069754 RepID=UPI0027AE5F7A|nr:CoA protein activase [Herbivorax sp. ANBcel31]MDQ2085480.1 CoA protein activase [Herbivorax sp. ANBcel31]